MKSEAEVSKKTTKKALKREAIIWQFGADKRYDFSFKWYVAMFSGMLVLLALAVFVVKSWSFVALLVVASLALLVYTKRPPRAVSYEFTSNKIKVDGVERSLDQFKSFGLLRNLDGSYKVLLIPAKRFSPALEVDFVESEGEKIIDFLGARLPMKKVELNFIDKIVQKIGL